MITIPTEAYPLTWPPTVPREQWRRRSSFSHRTIGVEVDDIFRQLKLAHAKKIVISSNLPLRSDGTPRADGPQRPGGDVGVAVYWVRNEKRVGRWVDVPYCMPCDRWDRIADNLHAIALSLQALRGVERWGAVTFEQAFTGFAALPPGSGETASAPIVTKRPWREVLGQTFGPWPELAADELLVLARSRHRKLMQLHHPDRGGDVAIAAELNVALAEAEQELAG